jgi:adenosylhomocysteine nucleosidase
MPSLNTAETLLVIAMPEESGGLAEGLGFPMVYTGVGKVNAAYRLTRALAANRGIARVINFGSAGSATLPRHALVPCDRFVQRDMDATAIGFLHGQTPFDETGIVIAHAPLFAGAQYVCGSGDSFETGTPKVFCDVVDMEAFALAKVCLYEGVAFASLKYITDGADGSAPGDWRENLHRAAEAFVGFMGEIQA